MYLGEVARDSTISLGKFITLADLVTEFPRDSDDGIYKVIDTYLRVYFTSTTMSLFSKLRAFSCIFNCRYACEFSHRLICLSCSGIQAHPTLNELERRKLCRVMDTGALSLAACVHAASNERLPVRVVVQVKRCVF